MTSSTSSVPTNQFSEVLLHDSYFPAILSGAKSIDARVNKPPYDTLDVGSIIKFVGTQTKSLEAYCYINRCQKYKTFQEMLTAEGLSKCLPTITSIEEGVKIYFNFPNYEANEKIYGVVAFQISLLPVPPSEKKECVDSVAPKIETATQEKRDLSNTNCVPIQPPKSESPLNFLHKASSENTARPMHQSSSSSSATLPKITFHHKNDNAHRDDIHGFTPLSQGRFISGSKDASLKIWDHTGNELLKLVPGKQGYPYWVTALTTFKNGLWASGSRDGAITVWNEKAEIINDFAYNPSSNVKNETISKDRNKSRINCIVEAFSDSGAVRFYTGTPKFVQLWNGLSGKLLCYYKTGNNDWVYCIEPVEHNRLIVVIGPSLETWQLFKRGEPQKSSLIRENNQERSNNQRPHISAIQRIDNQTHLLASALFDGTVKIVDLNQQLVVMNFHEHQGRVWSVINIQNDLIASSADDRTIKLWDIRQNRSIQTLSDNPGRVSSLLRISNTQFISGSCPDNLRTATEGASITFWNIRK